MVFARNERADALFKRDLDGIYKITPALSKNKISGSRETFFNTKVKQKSYLIIFFFMICCNKNFYQLKFERYLKMNAPTDQIPNGTPTNTPQSAPSGAPMRPRAVMPQQGGSESGQPVKRPMPPAAQRPVGAPSEQGKPAMAPAGQPMMQRRPVMPMAPSGVQMMGPRRMTPEQHMQKIMADLKEAQQKPDLIPCEHLQKMNDEPFSDVYITPDRKCYTWAGKSDAGLKVVDFTDYPEFLRQIEDAYDGKNRSYLLTYEGRHYRVERTIADGGPQFCARKMPVTVPALKKLGLPENLYKYLLSLSGRSGLILLAGPTGSGKSTTISALLKEYLSIKGGYCFTIEDPIELPLDGVYLTPTGEL